ncbi:DUF167 domain-containing protein [Cryobacterium adonitolivorans]|uniref:UPF0235 protein E3O42_06615 n=1 Tax=Cryobacterium adonitolivorans TaxID=1259189 RepID=A0A4R8W7L4_9MICO|nr:DUF167 domain-containing protein [Cryobacterium adonitolivorans]TFC03519.1 DUF167 domain-containing protein [Cryobacterium adonitolivorans]
MTASTQMVQVHVKPGSRKGPLVEADPTTTGAFTVFLQQRAVEGSANDALVRLLATHFGVPRSAVSILRGHHSRIKQVRIERVS